MHVLVTLCSTCPWVFSWQLPWNGRVPRAVTMCDRQQLDYSQPISLLPQYNWVLHTIVGPWCGCLPPAALSHVNSGSMCTGAELGRRTQQRARAEALQAAA